MEPQLVRGQFVRHHELKGFGKRLLNEAVGGGNVLRYVLALGGTLKAVGTSFNVRHVPTLGGVHLRTTMGSNVRRNRLTPERDGAQEKKRHLSLIHI